MGRVIRVGGADPSLTNTGLAKFDYDVVTGALDVVDIRLISTDRQVTKQTRQNSDDLRRCQETCRGIEEFLLQDCSIIFGEIPTGAQSARAAYAFGMVLGIWGFVSIRKHLVQVQPSETKKAVTGSKNGSKDEIMAWAYAAYPEVSWLTRKLKGETVLLNANEHMADACAVVKAGLLTDEFRRSLLLASAA